MKDITIKGTRIKKEIVFWAVSLFIAEVINIVGIVKYNTNWWELITQLHVVVIVSVLVYLLLLLFRGIWSAVKKK
jgi:hypothetical protein